MHICLLPLKIRFRDPAANLRHLEERLHEISRHRPDFVCLPECSLTGYMWEEEDVRRFAEPIPGPTTERMGELARRYNVFLCFGLLEVAGSRYYDSAVLLDREGRILLHHRKIEEHPPFALGNAVRAVDTELGRLSVVICGDLFNDEVVRQIDRTIDLLLVPIARSFEGKAPDPERWEREERQVYLDGVKAVEVTTAIVNALELGTDDPAFGGALIADGEGCLLAESPHGADEPLIYDLE
jgi:predicted amidohydrolase